MLGTAILVACRLEVVGSPSANTKFVFNGDFVDSGAWWVWPVHSVAATVLAVLLPITAPAYY